MLFILIKLAFIAVFFYIFPTNPTPPTPITEHELETFSTSSLWESQLSNSISFEKPALFKKFSLTTSHDFPNPITQAALSVLIYDPDHLNIIIRDADKTRWEIPFTDPYPHIHEPEYITSLGASNFEIEIQESPKLDIIIKRKSDGDVIFKLTDQFIFSDLYIEFSFLIPTKLIMGLGERMSSFLYKPGTYTLFAVSRPAGTYEDGTPGNNLNGHHPVILSKGTSGKYFVTLLRNLHPQEVVFSDQEGSGSKMTWKMIGGVIDLHFFLGDKSPESAIVKYHKYIGGWRIPPFWALGHQQGKQGYKNRRVVEDILTMNNNYGIPVDAIWMDSDYMHFHYDFSIRYWSFPDTNIFKYFNKRWIPLMRPFIPGAGFSYSTNYPDVWSITIREPKEGQPLMRATDYGNHLFVDFTHRKSKDFWDSMMNSLYMNWEYHGIWLSKNEGTDDCVKYNDGIICNRTKDHERKYYDLPFYPGGKNFYDLNIIGLEARHYDKTEEYDVRSLMMLRQLNFTFENMKKKFKLPLVFSRGSVFGSGKYSFHWISDTKSDWTSMRLSIPSIFSFNLFGFPFTGADICGFYSEHQSESELCTRWYQLATFYPFAKNFHSLDNAYDNFQEPYTFPSQNFKVMKSSILTRYSLLKQYYTLYWASEGNGELHYGSIFKPLFFVFEDDPKLNDMAKFENKIVEEQFMVGDILLVAPALYPKIEEVDVYFPAGSEWYDLRDFKKYEGGQNQKVNASLNLLVPYFLREGYILFTQNTSNPARKIFSTEDLDNVFQLTIALSDEDNKASGMIVDAARYDEITISTLCFNKNCLFYLEAEFKSDKLLLKGTKKVKEAQTRNLKIDRITLLGLKEKREFSEASLKEVGSYRQYNNVKIDKNANNCIAFDAPYVDLYDNFEFEVTFLN